MTGYRDEREEARARLKASVDALAERTNLQVQMQKEPLKMLGGASAVGALLGVVIGRQFKRTKKIYVDVDSPIKHQKELIKAQQKQQGKGGVGGALIATATTLAFKVLNDRVIAPRLEEMANNLLERAGQEPGPKGGQKSGGAASAASASRLPSRSPAASPSTGGTASFLKRDQGGEADDAARTGVPGGLSTPGTGSSVPTPTSTVVAKAQGSPIDPQEKMNPNIR